MDTTSETEEYVMLTYGIDVRQFTKAHGATSLRICRDIDKPTYDSDHVVGRITVVVDQDNNVIHISDVWQ